LNYRLGFSHPLRQGKLAQTVDVDTASVNADGLAYKVKVTTTFDELYVAERGEGLVDLG
jgi:hypothetical protein